MFPKKPEHESLLDEERIDLIGDIPEDQIAELMIMEVNAMHRGDRIGLRSLQKIKRLYLSRNARRAELASDTIKETHKGEQDQDAGVEMPTPKGSPPEHPGPAPDASQASEENSDGGGWLSGWGIGSEPD